MYFKIFFSISATISQICLGVQGKSVLSSFDGLYDMEEQAQLREDCAALVGQCVCVCGVYVCMCVCACVCVCVCVCVSVCVCVCVCV